MTLRAERTNSVATCFLWTVPTFPFAEHDILLARKKRMDALRTVGEEAVSIQAEERVAKVCA